MRIAFHAPMKPPDHPVPSGDRRMARLLVQALELAGHSVELASRLRTHDSAGGAARQQARAAEAAAEAERLIAGWRRHPAAAPAAWFTYHVYHKAPDWLGPSVADALRIPYLIAEPSHAPKQADGPWAVGHRAAAAAIRRADALFCLTRLDRAQIERLRPPGRILDLPPFLDAAPFAAAAGGRPAARSALAGQAGLDPDLPWLLAVGMMRRRDKLESYRRLAGALARLPPAGWQLVLAGDGEARDEVLAALAPFTGRLRHLGAVAAEAMPALYAACDICVWPAAGEAYGMALLEAQAAGLPVVAGRVRGVPDVVVEGETGLLTPDNDDGAFAAALERLLTDAPLRRRMGDAARAFVSERRGIDGAARLLDGELARLVPAAAP